jgi:hypothetical protein
MLLQHDLLLKRWLNEEDQCHSERDHATERS